MAENKKIHTDTFFFYIGLGLLPLAVIVLLLLRNSDLLNSGLFFCVIKEKTGICCPGCGGTRAMMELVKGNFAGCFYNHPAILFGIAEYFFFMLFYSVRTFVIKTEKEINLNYFIAAFFIVVAVQWIYKLVIGY